ncbi:MAG: ABC transporter substrate-binding protein [Spirochaetaceae bacterium]|nr:ABC transporter substrate-binding protein [Spirochaetaceae bacterium]
MAAAAGSADVPNIQVEFSIDTDHPLHNYEPYKEKKEWMIAAVEEILVSYLRNNYGFAQYNEPGTHEYSLLFQMREVETSAPIVIGAFLKRSTPSPYLEKSCHDDEWLACDVSVWILRKAGDNRPVGTAEEFVEEVRELLRPASGQVTVATQRLVTNLLSRVEVAGSTEDEKYDGTGDIWLTAAPNSDAVRMTLQHTPSDLQLSTAKSRLNLGFWLRVPGDRIEDWAEYNSIRTLVNDSDHFGGGLLSVFEFEGRPDLAKDITDNRNELRGVAAFVQSYHKRTYQPQVSSASLDIGKDSSVDRERTVQIQGFLDDGDLKAAGESVAEIVCVESDKRCQAYVLSVRGSIEFARALRAEDNGDRLQRLTTARDDLVSVRDLLSDTPQEALKRELSAVHDAFANHYALVGEEELSLAERQKAVELSPQDLYYVEQLLDSALMLEEFVIAMELSLVARGLGADALSLFGYQQVFERTDDADIADQAIRAWRQMGEDDGWLHEDSMKRLPKLNERVDPTDVSLRAPLEETLALRDQVLKIPTEVAPREDDRYQLSFLDDFINWLASDESFEEAVLRTGITNGGPSVYGIYEDTLDRTAPDLIQDRLPISFGGTFAFNTSKTPFDNRDVRRALLEGTNLGDFAAQRAAKGVDLPERWWPIYPRLAPYTRQSELPPEAAMLYEYDPENAKQTLAEAGYPDGFTVNFYTGNWATILRQATIMKDQWAKLGVELNFIVNERAIHNQIIKDGADDMTRMGYGSGNPGRDVNMINNWVAWGSRNQYHLNDPEFDEYSRAMQVVMDEGKRNEIMKEATVYILNEVAAIPTTPLNGPSLQPSAHWIKNQSQMKTINRP